VTAKAKRIPSTITVHVPLAFVTRGGRKTIVAPASDIAPQPRFDNALIKALALAFRWRRRIESGKYASITELAKAEGINQSYACRLLRLTLLAPDVVNAILDGRQSPAMTMKEAMKPFSVSWAEQVTSLHGQGLKPRAI
jgi:hypothetical protein